MGETAIGMVFVGRVALGADRGRPVMVRRVEKGAEHDDGTLQALREAANEVLAFRHPRVLPGVEARLGTSLVIANGYAEGELLRQLARTARTRAVALAPAVATRLVADLVATLVDVRDALAELGRERPLVGVCPDCVLVDPQGRCHLSDLGLATLRRPPRHAELMAYRAPEQLGPPGEADERSVIFSVGVIWWELLANHSLFGGGSQAAVWQRVRQAAILPPAAASPEARAVLMRALERDPAQRFATLDAFAAALSGLDAGSTAPSEEVARAVDELAGAALRARRAALAAEAPPSGAANAVLTPASALPIGGEDASAAALPRPASFLSTRPAEEVPDEGDWELEGRGAATPAGGSRGSPAPGQRRPGDAAPVTGVAPGAPPVTPLSSPELPATVREGPVRRQRSERRERQDAPEQAAAPGPMGEARPRSPAGRAATEPALREVAPPPREAGGAGPWARPPAGPATRDPALRPETSALPHSPLGAVRPSTLPPRPRGSVTPPRPGRRASEEPGGVMPTPACAPPAPGTRADALLAGSAADAPAVRLPGATTPGLEAERNDVDLAPDSQRDTVEIGVVGTVADVPAPGQGDAAGVEAELAPESTEPLLASESLAGPRQRSGTTARPPPAPAAGEVATHEPSAVGLGRLAASIRGQVEPEAEAVPGAGIAVVEPTELGASPRRRSLAPWVLLAGGASFTVAFAVAALVMIRDQPEAVLSASPGASAVPEASTSRPVAAAASALTVLSSVSPSPSLSAAPAAAESASVVPAAPPSSPPPGVVPAALPSSPLRAAGAIAPARRAAVARPAEAAMAPAPGVPADGEGAASSPAEPRPPAVTPRELGPAAPSPDAPSPYD